MARLRLAEIQARRAKPAAKPTPSKKAASINIWRFSEPHGHLRQKPNWSVAECAKWELIYHR